MSINRPSLVVLTLVGGLLGIGPSAFAQANPQPVPPAKQAADVKPAAASEPLPAGKEVFAKYLEATGTEGARRAIKNRVVTGSFKNDSMGLDGTFKGKMNDGGKFVFVVDLGPVGKVVRWTDGKAAAMVQPQSEPRVLKGDDLLDLQRDATLFPELTPDAFFKTIETKGVEKVDGQDCYKVETTQAGGSKRTWFYSKQSGLLVKWSGVKQRGPMEIATEVTLSDWKEFDGVKVACTQKNITSVGEESFEVVIHTDKVEHNAKLSDADFAVPEELKDVVSETNAAPSKDGAPAEPKHEKPKPDGK